MPSDPSPTSKKSSNSPEKDSENLSSVVSKNKVTFPVVGIGASAGGLDAFKNLFQSMPPDSGMAFVLVQHLDPTHESMMTDLLVSARVKTRLFAATF